MSPASGDFDAPLARLLAEHACTGLGHDWARALDFNDQEHFLELFVPDAVLQYDGVHSGLEAIAAWVGSRPRAERTRHLVSNSWIDLLDADHARGLSYLTLWRADAEGLAPDAVAGADGPVAVGHSQDRFVRTDDGWRFAARTVHWAIRATGQDG